MAQPGKYSNVDVLRKYVGGSFAEAAGTTQMVGSGLKPRMMGLRKVGGSLWSVSAIVEFGNVSRRGGNSLKGKWIVGIIQERWCKRSIICKKRQKG